MTYKYHYEASPKQEMILGDDLRIYPNEVYRVDVTRFGRHYLGVPDERDCRIVHPVRLTKKDLDNYVRR